MRVLLLALVASALAACEQTPTSDSALVGPGGRQPRAGLWAVLDENCPAPASAEIAAWPDCSLPVWIRGGEITFALGGPTRTRFVVAEGTPGLVQLAPSGPSRSAPFMRPRSESPDPAPADPWLREYAYVAVRPEGSSPFARARVWSIPCPLSEQQSIPGVKVTDDQCKVSTEQGLRRLAANAARERPGYRAVWIAP